MKARAWSLDFEGAREDKFVRYLNGRVLPIPCMKPGTKILPLIDSFKDAENALRRHSDSILILEDCVNSMINPDKIDAEDVQLMTLEALETMPLEGRITGIVDSDRPFTKVN